MKISDVMSRSFEIIPGDSTIDRAARVMAEIDVVVLPVGEESNLIGIITERDITVRVVAEGSNPTEIKVADVMSTQVQTCRPDDAVDDIRTQMRERSIRQMPVVDEAGKLVGIVSLAALERRDVSAEGDQSASPRTPTEAASQ